MNAFNSKEIKKKIIKKQSHKFLEGRSSPDFAEEDFEINYKIELLAII
mgnify:CR=1 FL=1